MGKVWGRVSPHGESELTVQGLTGGWSASDGLTKRGLGWGPGGLGAQGPGSHDHLMPCAGSPSTEG